MEVTVGGVRYVPEASVPELNDERLKEAISGLVALIHSGEKHKAIPRAWDVLKILAPDVAELVDTDSSAAFARFCED